MCITLGELKRAAADWCARFDPAVVPIGQLAEMIKDACDIRKMMTTGATLSAEHRAATGPWLDCHALCNSRTGSCRGELVG